MGPQRRRLCLLAVLGLVGCGTSSAAPDSSAEQGADFIDCAAETRATPYVPGLSETSASGTWKVTLLDNSFLSNGKTVSGAPVRGSDTWTIEVDDAASGKPTDGVVAGVSPYMPDHRHGTTPVMVSAAGPGTYTLTPLYLYMAGYWEITIDLDGTAAGGPGATDSAMFPLCVPN